MNDLNEIRAEIGTVETELRAIRGRLEAVATERRDLEATIAEGTGTIEAAEKTLVEALAAVEVGTGTQDAIEAAKTALEAARKAEKASAVGRVESVRRVAVLEAVEGRLTAQRDDLLARQNGLVGQRLEVVLAALLDRARAANGRAEAAAAEVEGHYAECVAACNLLRAAGRPVQEKLGILSARPVLGGFPAVNAMISEHRDRLIAEFHN